MRKLSPELRNPIYEMVLIESASIDICRMQQQPGLTRTCRELRVESVSMYYFRNSFLYTTKSQDGDKGLDRLISWFMHIGPQNCAELRHVCVTIGLECDLMIRDPKTSMDPWCSLVSRVNDFGCVKNVLIDAELSEQWSLPEKWVRMMGQTNGRSDDWSRTVIRTGVKNSLQFYLSTLSFRYEGTTPPLSGLRHIQCPERLEEVISAARTLCSYFVWRVRSARYRGEGIQRVTQDEAKEARREYDRFMRYAVQNDGEA